MNEESLIKQIKTPQEFIELHFPHQDSAPQCIECNTFKYNTGEGFLEIFTLDDLQAFPNHFFGSQTRKKFYTMVLITQGKMEEVIGHQHYVFEENQMYFIAENQLHLIERWSKDLKGVMCLFDSDYFLLCLKHQIKLNSFPFFQVGHQPYLKLSERETEMMEHLFWKLQSEKVQKKTFNDDLLVRMFLNIILLEAERIYNYQSLQLPFVLSRKEQLVAKFQLLVNQKVIDVKQVSDFALLLHVHPHYLNDVVKEVTGVSASGYIHKVLIEEAKSRLIQTNHTVSQIAMELNFTEESYFGRFFKKNTGVTPLQYRKTHKQH
ncbi:MAG: helix-turn-helix transcriptional regulator [Flavobacteriaceae bacterium]|jgi:AraC-like DNA-binding protein|nr:helix-turn-helix transcriptional regulator [Flavobacteriaceae bacterium]